MNAKDSRLLAEKMKIYGDVHQYKDADSLFKADQLIVELMRYLLNEQPKSISALPKKYKPILDVEL